jgi:hypothetical protein
MDRRARPPRHAVRYSYPCARGQELHSLLSVACDQKSFMSSGIEAGLEVCGTESMLPVQWLAVAPSVLVDEVPNRTIFTLLAGHRSELGIDPVVPLRGLPRDVSKPIQELYDAWGGTAFDASWVTFEEIMATVERLTRALEELSQQNQMAPNEFIRLHRGISIDGVLAFLSVYQARGFNTRLVFWFTPI